MRRTNEIKKEQRNIKPVQRKGSLARLVVQDPFPIENEKGKEEKKERYFKACIIPRKGSLASLVVKTPFPKKKERETKKQRWKLERNISYFRACSCSSSCPRPFSKKERKSWKLEKRKERKVL